MNNSLLQYKVALTFLPGIGDITAKKLIAYCGSVEAVFKEKKRNLLKIPGIGEVLAEAVTGNQVLYKAEEEMSFIEKHQIITLFYLDDNYPNRLKHCIDSPILLYYKGKAQLNTHKVLSVVGTRNATEYGKQVTHEIIKGLKCDGLLIVSGLAYGIDSAAHRASLEVHVPTVAVLAHGLDTIYPSLHKSLAEKMLSEGGLLTDFPSRTNPDRENFPKRNRIIAGLSDAVVVVEAGARGGALITANIANSYNRDVFAVPGRIKDTFSEGCNNLIKNNIAALIQSADDIKYMLGWKNSLQKNTKIQKELFISLNKDEEIIIQILQTQGDTGIDFLCEKTQLGPTKVSSTLLHLEFEGIIKSLPGKIYRLL
ncbi:MAG: DNA-processing protein DprA [Lentimicrobiaceae bacterium]|nr:DNA-processing protein DprA [Lentimicrobiaceae bacterium]